MHGFTAPRLLSLPTKRVYGNCLLLETLEVWRGSGSQERFGDLEFGSLGVGRQRLVLVFSIFKLSFYFCVLYMRFLFLFSEYIYPFLFLIPDTAVNR